MYSKTFNISLIGLAMITASVILAVTSNIILSLGMVGALSIVRFRTAIKDPIDVVFMFWAIAAGIISGAGLYLLAILSCLIIGIVLFAFSKVNIRYEQYLLILNYADGKTEKFIFKTLSEAVGTYKIKSKTKTPNNYELTVEIRAKQDKTDIVNILSEYEGINNVAMVSYDGGLCSINKNRETFVMKKAFIIITSLLTIATLVIAYNIISAQGGNYINVKGFDMSEEGEQMFSEPVEWDDKVFPQDQVFDVEIFIDDDDFKDLCENADDKSFYPCTIIYNGVKLNNTGYQDKRQYFSEKSFK